MKRYLQYTFMAAISGLLAISCIEELEQPTPSVSATDEVTILVPRVGGFANKYVTKAGYGSDEGMISSLAVLVFNNDGTLIHIEESSGSSYVSLNKSMLDSPAQSGKLSSSTLVVLANVALADVRNAEGEAVSTAEVLSLSSLQQDYSLHIDDGRTIITSLGDGFTGFPMLGMRSGVDLTPTAARQGAVEVPMQILYAKVNFKISVEEGTENQGKGSFALTSYSVNNASKVTTLTQPEGATASSSYSTTGTTVETTASSFTFYVSESRYHHGSDLKGIYPSDDWLTADADEDGSPLNGVKHFYDDIIQQYKPKLALAGSGSPGSGLATCVTLTGQYTDYRGAVWNVDYKVYLGKDNALNFEVDRNSEYTNHITIKGIRNNDSYVEKDGDGNVTADRHVWIDHRVNVTGASGAADHVTITRETLIDSHIEVRPLRVSWTGDEYYGVRVYLPVKSDGSLVDWIGVERFTGENCGDGATYCYADGKSTGKRKYFTTTLISELQTKGGEFGVMEDDGRKFIFLKNEECAWIYFDENTKATARTAQIELEFYTPSGDTASEVYNVTQCGLQTLGGYAVESYEEYLHTYDSSDRYNLSTSPADYTQQGLAWGLDGQRISNSVIVAKSTSAGIYNIEPRYDFLHANDNSDNTYYLYSNGGWVQTITDGDGLHFTDYASEVMGVKVKDMGTMPENAYQYCLSKNKFVENADGSVAMKVHWYLPDSYEMQAVLSAGDGTSDFGSDVWYWSSQPSAAIYESGLLNYEYLGERDEYARAVSKTKTADISRNTQNRIRCLHSEDGIEANMDGRIPDGVGGNFTFYMRAWRDKQKSAEAYFKYLLPEAETSSGEPTPVINDSFGYNSETSKYSYPDASNHGEFEYITTTDSYGNGVEGFIVNPAEKSNWSTTGLNYYTTLAKFPGLSQYTLEKYTLGAIQVDTYKETTTPKSKVTTITDLSSITLDKVLPSATDLKPLDHLLGGNLPNVSFDKADGNENPVFNYDETETAITTSTRQWNVPVYSDKTYPMKTDATVEVSGTGSAEGTSTLFGSMNLAKRYAFEGNASNTWNGAYKKAKEDALKNLKNKVAQDYPGWSFREADVRYTELNWQSPKPFVDYPETSSGALYKATCTVNLTATVTITQNPSLTLWSHTSGGCWSDEVITTGNSGPVIQADEMRMYCGNSFTITCTDPEYEITKVKVYYSKGNLIKSTTIPVSSTYARLVESSLIPEGTGVRTIATASTSLDIFDKGDHIQLTGMDYSENSDNSEGWQQWSGSGTDSITLVLTDHHIQNGDWTAWYNQYSYKTAAVDLSKYIIIDRIEVKRTRRSTE